MKIKELLQFYKQSYFLFFIICMFSMHSFAQGQLCPLSDIEQGTINPQNDTLDANDGFVWVDVDVGEGTWDIWGTNLDSNSLYMELFNADGTFMVGRYSNISGGVMYFSLTISGGLYKMQITDRDCNPVNATYGMSRICMAPTIPTITATEETIACGESTTLSWSGAALNDADIWYVYSGSCGGELVTTQTGTSLTVSPTTSTNYFIRGQGGTGGCTYDGSTICKTISINIITPSFTLQDDTVCLSEGVVTGGGGLPTGGFYTGLGVTDTGDGISYTFDPAAVGVGNSTGISYIGPPSSCGVAVITETINVADDPIVSFTAPGLEDTCINGAVQTGLTGGTPTGGIYSGNGVTDDGNGMTYSFNPFGTSIGFHTITYSYGANGCSDFATDSVRVYNLPNASVEDSSNPTFTANTNGATYQWINCHTDMPIPGETSQSFTAIEPGSYYVSVTLNGCTRLSFCYTVEETLSIDEEEIKDNQLRLYPNPTNNLVYINVDVKKVEIYTITGKKVLEVSTKNIDVSALKAGVYFVNIHTETGSIVTKSLIKR